MTSLLRELSMATRRLLREKAFSATVLATLALCLGANTVIFTVVDSVLLRPLPFSDPDRLVVVYNTYPKANVQRAGAAVANYYDRRGRIAAFTDIAITRGDGATVGEPGSPRRVPMQRATPSFWSVLGVQAAHGRLFTEEENEYGHSDVVVLTDAYWKTHFNASPEAIGQTLRVNEVPTTIIGVLPPGFRYLSQEAQLWVPLPSNPDQRALNTRHDNSAEMIARLRPGVTLAQAQAQIDALNAQLAADDPFAAMVAGAGFATIVDGLHAEHVAGIRPTLLLLQTGVLLLLVIGAVNLVNLLLIRASARAKDMAVRRVLGASRGRIALQAVAESVVLSAGGGVLGLGLAAGALRGLAALGADRLPLGATIGLDARTVAVVLAASVVVGLILALPVITFSAHGTLAATLSCESRSGTTSRATHRVRHVLIVAQVAAAFVLLASAGLLGLSFKRVLAVDPGFQSANLLSGQVALPWTNYREEGQRIAFAERLLADLRSLPGVKHAAASSTLPFAGNYNRSALFVEGRTPAPGESLQAHSTYMTFGDYFQVAGIPLVAGRLLNEADSRSEEFVCVIDEDVARLYWPEGSALGHRIFNGPPEIPGVKAATVVGVVGRVKERDLADTDVAGAVYFPFRAERAPLWMFVAVRTLQPAESVGAALRQAVLRIDPGLPLDNLRSMQERMHTTLQPRRTPLVLAALFAGAALILATLGIYGVLAYTVAQRQREIGVRMALGAQPGEILRQFLLLGGTLLGIGTALGLAGAWLGGRFMAGLLYGVQPADATVLAATAFAIAGTGLLASFLPSRRAARVHPLVALRSD